MNLDPVTPVYSFVPRLERSSGALSGMVGLENYNFRPKLPAAIKYLTLHPSLTLETTIVHTTLASSCVHHMHR